MRIRFLPYLAYAFLLSMANVSCIKDVDFDQAGDITMQPEIQTDLLIFEIDQKDFVDPATNQSKLIIRDTVRLEFLDDSYIQNDLEKVEFSFKYRNSFPQGFFNKISFLSENNALQHQVSFYIGGGAARNPAVTEKIELILPQRIQVIKNSIKMVVELEVMPGNEPFTGILNFESKGLFSFQF